MDARIRVPMFMAAHVGDVESTSARFGDPGTRIELLVDGTPIGVQSSEYRHSGSVYRYWEGTIGAGVSGTLTVEARTYLGGELTTVREVQIDFR